MISSLVQTYVKSIVKGFRWKMVKIDTLFMIKTAKKNHAFEAAHTHW